MTQPVALDMRAQLGAARAQGTSRQTCVAFAVTAAHEWMRGNDQSLSEEFCLWAAKARDGLAGEATTVRWALTGLAEEGQVSAAVWPYGQPPWPAAPPAACAAAERFAAGAWRPIPPTIDDIAAELVGGAAVLLTVGFVPTAWYDLQLGPIVDVRAGARRAGSHAVTVVGTRVQGGTVDALLIRNSWGPDWGEEGHAYISRPYLEDQAVVAHVLEAA